MDGKPNRSAAKREAVITAAHAIFMNKGYAEASMDEIAASASVSVKTIYRHFANKADLYAGVMNRACTQIYSEQDVRDEAALSIIFPWFEDTSADGLTGAGEAYLDHLLSPDQLALYRAVTRDAERFPEAGRLYRETVSAGRSAMLATYLSRFIRARGTSSEDAARLAEIYEALLRAGLFEDLLHGLRAATPEDVKTQARRAAASLQRLLREA